MARHRSPGWLVAAFDATVRPLLWKPERILAPYVSRGDRVADIGCGTGYYCPALCRLVGPDGEVVLVDVQQSMLERALARCKRSGSVGAQLTPVVADGSCLPIDGHLDFALLSWMLHEVDDVTALWRRLVKLLVPGGRALVIEPRLHVSRADYERELAPAIELGLMRQDIETILYSYAALLSAPGRAEMLEQ